MFKSFILSIQFLSGPVAPSSPYFLHKESMNLLHCFFSSHSLFSLLQSGACPVHSPETALGKVIHDYFTAKPNGNLEAIISLDLPIVTDAVSPSSSFPGPPWVRAAAEFFCVFRLPCRLFFFCSLLNIREGSLLGPLLVLLVQVPRPISAFRDLSGETEMDKGEYDAHLVMGNSGDEVSQA